MKIYKLNSKTIGNYYKLLLLLTLIGTFQYIHSQSIENEFKEYLNSSQKDQQSQFPKIFYKVIVLNNDLKLKSLQELEEKYILKKDNNYIQILKILSETYYNLDKKDLFLNYYYRALNLAIENDDKLSIGAIYLLKTNYFKNENKLDSCIYYCLLAEDKYRSANYSSIPIYQMIGDVYYKLDLFDDALSYYYLIIKESFHDEDWNKWRKIVIYTNLGNIYSSTNRFEEAFNAFNIAKKQIYNSKIGDNRQLAHLNKCIADCFYDQNNYDSASFYINYSISLLENSVFVIDYPRVFISAGKIFTKIGKFEDAEINLNKALNLIDTSDFTNSIDVFNALKDLYISKKDFKKAIDYEQIAFHYSQIEKINSNSAKILNSKVKYDINILNLNLEQKNFQLISLAVFFVLLLCILILVIFSIRKSKNKDKILFEKSMQLINQEEKLISSYNYESLNINKNIDLNVINSQDINDKVTTEIPENNEFAFEIPKDDLDDKVSLYSKNEISLTDIKANDSNNLTELENSTNSSYLLTLATEVNHILLTGDYLKDTEFNIHDMAKICVTNRTYISRAINSVYKQNFQIFINEIRVKKIINKLNKDKTFREMKIDTIMIDMGFNNRVTFNRSFQKYTGLTPSVFIKKVINGDIDNTNL